MKTGKQAWKEYVEKAGGVKNIEQWQKIGFEMSSISPKHQGLKFGARFEDERYEGAYYFTYLCEEFIKLNDEDKIKLIVSILKELDKTRRSVVEQKYRDPEFYMWIYTLTMRQAYLFEKGKHDHVQEFMNDSIENIKKLFPTKELPNEQKIYLKDSPQKRWDHFLKEVASNKIETWDMIAFEMAGYACDEIPKFKEEDKKYFLVLVKEFLKQIDENKLKVVKFIIECLQTARVQGVGEKAAYDNVSPAYLFAMSEKWK